MFDCVRFLGNFVVFNETGLLRLEKNSYIALGLMRNGLVFRTTGFCFTHNGYVFKMSGSGVAKVSNDVQICACWAAVERLG